MANGKSLLSGILSRDSDRGTSWKDLATSYFSGTSKNNVRRRNAQLFTFGMGKFEEKMTANVVNNLQESQDKKVFEQAALNNKYEKYNTLLTEDEAYKANPFYFKDKSRAKYDSIYSDSEMDMSLIENKAFRKKEIADYEKALVRLHEEKIKTGNIDKRMTKEVFFKPFEDHWREKQKDIAAPKNLSIIHNAWDRLTNRDENKPVTAAELKKVNRNSFDYLTNPDVITDVEQIERDRDPSIVTYNKNEGMSFLLKNIAPSDPARRSIIRSFTNNKKESFTKTELEIQIATSQVDFNPILEKNLVINEAFDIRYRERRGLLEGESLPTAKENPDAYVEYYLEKQNNLDAANNQGSPETRALRENIFDLDRTNDMIAKSEFANNPEKSPLYKVKQKLEQDIKIAGVDKVKFQTFNTIQDALLDPENGYKIKSTIRETAKKQPGYNADAPFAYETLNDYVSETMQEMMAQYEVIFK